MGTARKKAKDKGRRRKRRLAEGQEKGAYG